MRKKTDIPLSSVSIEGRPLCNLPFADLIDLLRGREEQVQKLTERLEKTAASYGMEISADYRKIIVYSIKPIPYTNGWMEQHWKMERREEVDQFIYLWLTYQRRNISKGSKDQSGAGTLSRDKASNTMEKQRNQFSYKD